MDKKIAVIIVTTMSESISYKTSIALSDILFVKANLAHCIFYLLPNSNTNSDTKIEVLESFSIILNRLIEISSDFIQSHRSYIISITHASYPMCYRKINRKHIVFFTDKLQAIYGLTYKKNLEDALGFEIP